MKRMSLYLALAATAALAAATSAEAQAVPTCSALSLYANAARTGLCRSLSPTTQNLWVCELSGANPDVHITFNAGNALTSPSARRRSRAGASTKFHRQLSGRACSCGRRRADLQRQHPELSRPTERRAGASRGAWADPGPDGGAGGCRGQPAHSRRGADLYQHRGEPALPLIARARSPEGRNLSTKGCVDGRKLYVAAIPFSHGREFGHGGL